MSYNIQNTVFTKMPIIDQAAAVIHFNEMDNLLLDCLRDLVDLQPTFYLLMGIVTEVSSSLTHGKIIFHRKQISEKEKKKHKIPKNYGTFSTPEELLLFNNKPDTESIDFLKKIFLLYNKWSIGTLKFEDLKNLDLNRATLETIINSFLEYTETYVENCFKISSLRERIAESGTEDINDLVGTLSLLEEEIMKLEKNTKCDQNKLFYIVRNISNRMGKYNKIKNQIHLAYLRVVYKAARERAAAEQQILENFQNGSIGLMRAILNYNPNRGVFSSYAKTWALQYILLKLKEEANTIKLPISLWQTGNDLEGIHSKLEQGADGETIASSEIAVEAGLSKDRVEKVYEYINNTKVISIENQSNLDASNEDARKEEMYDPFSDSHPFIDSYMDLLTPRQSFILCLLYGMYEKLPGDLPKDELLVRGERLRQKIAGKILQ